jgi:beta/gamma crystallin
MKSKVIAGILVSATALCAAAPAYARHCATLYEHVNYRGDRRNVSSGENTSWIGGPWNDQISSIQVAPGCVLNAYEHVNYGGGQKSFSGNVPRVGSGWNDEMSSFTCSCQ